MIIKYKEEKIDGLVLEGLLVALSPPPKSEKFQS